MITAKHYAQEASETKQTQHQPENRKKKNLCTTSSKMAEKIKSWGRNEPDSALRAEQTKVRRFLSLLAAGPRAAQVTQWGSFSPSLSAF